MTFAVANHVPEWLIHPDDQKRLPNPVAVGLTEAAAKRHAAQKEAENDR